MEARPEPIEERIVRVPDVLGGKPVVRGTRIPVEIVLGYLVATPDFDSLLLNYPRLTVDDVRACLAYGRDTVTSAFEASKEHGVYRMPSRRSVSTVVLNESETRVLLHRRGDVPLWSLPGGGVESGEGWDEAAIREVREETGYEVEIEYFVGEYDRPELGEVKRVYLAHLTGGEPRPAPPESVAVRWFPVSRFPLNRMPLHEQYVRHALAYHAGPLRMVQRPAPLTKLGMRALFAMSDLRAAARRLLRPT